MRGGGEHGTRHYRAAATNLFAHVERENLRAVQNLDGNFVARHQMLGHCAMTGPGAWSHGRLAVDRRNSAV